MTFNVGDKVRVLTDVFKSVGKGDITTVTVRTDGIVTDNIQVVSTRGDRIASFPLKPDEIELVVEDEESSTVDIDGLFDLYGDLQHLFQNALESAVISRLGGNESDAELFHTIGEYADMMLNKLEDAVPELVERVKQYNAESEVITL